MNKYFQEAFNIVRARRQLAESKLQDTISSLQEDMEFAKLEQQRNAIGFDLARAMSLSNDFGDLNAQYLKLCEAVQKRAIELGYSVEDLSVHYFCSACNDTGMVDGKDCVCIKQLVYDILSSNCIGKITETSSFEDVDMNFYPETYKLDMKKRLAWLKKWGESFPNPQHSYVVLSGKVGTGKSYSMSILANTLMMKGLAVLMLNSQQLNRLFLQYHLAAIDRKVDIFAPLLECDLLIIDDLGTESLMNNVTINYLYELIASRDNLPIAITTNLGSSQLLERYGQRIYSRLFQKGKCMAINFDGIDLRMI